MVKENNQVKTKTKKKIEKEIKKENKKEKKYTKQKKDISVDNSVLTEPYLVNKEELKESRKRKILTTLEVIVIFIFSIIMLILLCNRTFFSTKYKTSKININIPHMMFFKKDDGNTLVFKTLRKSKYVENYFDGELNKMRRYNCDGYSFFYDENNEMAIYSIKIEKDFAVKEVTINYAVGDANCLCNANATGKTAEDICSK